MEHRSVSRGATAFSCAVDGFALGRWQHVRGIADGDKLRERNQFVECGGPRHCAEINNGTSHCVDWEYANATCGAALSEERLCHALNCRSMLIVGDSTMQGLFQAIKLYAHHTEASPRWQLGAECPTAPLFTHVHLCSQLSSHTCPGVNVSFWRNDHLLAAP
jgi:hypothetical protein